MENSLLILADDLTGALDTGVQFAKKGIEVLVFPSPEAVEKQHTQDSTVLVINTNTRHLPPEEARSIVKAMAKTFQNCSFFYKKTDSCLRGNIGAELEALMEATKSTRLPFVPAFPDLKRITRNGCQYLDGIPIHQSSMARDTLNPVTESFIPAIIAKQSAIPVRLIERNSTVPEGNAPKEILVFDGETSEDMLAIARLLGEQNLLKAVAGCAGFAEALMKILPLEKNKKNNCETVENLPVLIVSGSLHEASINQVMFAREKNISCFGLPGEKILRPGWLESGEAKALITGCSQTLLEKGIGILGTQESLGLIRIIRQNERSPDISGILGYVTRNVIGKTGPLHLVVFGGDTTLGIINALRYRQLRPLEEIRPGIVLSKAGGRKEFLVTKAGAFGEVNLISAVSDFFKSVFSAGQPSFKNAKGDIQGNSRRQP